MWKGKLVRKVWGIKLCLLCAATSLFIGIAQASVDYRSQIYFEYNSSFLTPEAKLVADDIVHKVKSEQPFKLVLIGHADRIGRASYNEKLSNRRVHSVAEYITKALIPDHYNVELKSYGERNLPYPTNDGVPEPLNRCVEIVITPHQP